MKSIVVSSGKGGVGKSMLASSLAILFSKNKKIIAADCDVDAPNLAVWLGIESSFTKTSENTWDKVEKISTAEKPVIDYKKCNGCGICVKNCPFGALRLSPQGKPRLNKFTCEGCGACEILCPRKAIKLKPVKTGKIKIKNTKYGFKLIIGELIPGETGSGKIVSEIKKRANEYLHELIIIDSSPGTGCPVIAALQDASFVILVTEPTPSAFSDLKRVLEVVNYFKLPYGVVINKWDINTKLNQKIKKEFKEKILGQISYDQKIFKAISQFKPIIKTNLKAKEEIKKIFEKLNANRYK